jgi:uncharacterized protein (DUF1015 family)
MCRANTSPIFSLYRSSEVGISGILSRIVRERPYLEGADSSGNLHRLWPIHRTEDVEMIKREMADKALFIADGHHRYETSFEYRREMSAKNRSSSAPYDYTLMFLANLTDEGITVLPTHRLIKEIPEDIVGMLSRYFEIETIAEDFDIGRRLSGRKNSFGFFKKREKVWRLLTYRGHDLPEMHPALQGVDVITLHELVFKKVLPHAEIGYEKDIAKTLDQVNQGEYAGAFFLNPTRVEDVERVSLSSMRMPQKSTYFYPKLLTGLVLNKWD